MPPQGVEAEILPGSIDGRSERAVRPRSCTICMHPQRPQIEMMRVAGVPFRTLAKEFGVTKDALCRHWAAHVTEKRKGELMAGPAAVEGLVNAAAKESRSALEFLRVTHSILFNQFINAAEGGDKRSVIDTAKPMLDALREVAKMTGELRTWAAGVTINNNQINFVGSPEFAVLSTGLLQIARDHPSAKADIIGLLRRLDEPQSAADNLPSIAVMDESRGNGTAAHGPLMRSDGPIIECAAVEVSQ
jgi:hypothetical protein